MSTACSVCLTTKGALTPYGKPRRYDGVTYGVPGQICDTCRARLRRAGGVITRLCDLCGEPPYGKLHDGAPFEIEGRVCTECEEELRDEQQAAAYQRASATMRMRGWAGRILVVLSPGFTAAELTPRARCRLMVIAAGNREARLSQPKPPKAQPRPAVACADCDTTEGKVDSRFNTIERLSGAKFGVDGKLCRACYQRRTRLHKTAPRLEMSA